MTNDEREFQQIMSAMSDPTAEQILAFRKSEVVRSVDTAFSVFLFLAFSAALPWVAVSWVAAIRYILG